MYLQSNSSDQDTNDDRDCNGNFSNILICLHYFFDSRLMTEQLSLTSNHITNVHNTLIMHDFCYHETSTSTVQHTCSIFSSVHPVEYRLCSNKILCRNGTSLVSLKSQRRSNYDMGTIIGRKSKSDDNYTSTPPPSIQLKDIGLAMREELCEHITRHQRQAQAILIHIITVSHHHSITAIC